MEMPTNSADPFELAHQLGVRIVYENLPNGVVGIYTPLKHSCVIIIQKALHPETQEKVCDHLILHHTISNQMIILDNDAFNELESTKRQFRFTVLQRRLSTSH